MPRCPFRQNRDREEGAEGRYDITQTRRRTRRFSSATEWRTIRASVLYLYPCLPVDGFYSDKVSAYSSPFRRDRSRRGMHVIKTFQAVTPTRIPPLSTILSSHRGSSAFIPEPTFPINRFVSLPSTIFLPLPFYSGKEKTYIWG